VTAGPLSVVHRDLIITLVTAKKCPRSTPNAPSSDAGGLISYGPDFVDQYRRAAG
jgi:hypothetical protein